MTATEFQINSYDFTFWDNNSSCHWDSIRWTFENPEVQWIIEPDSTTIPAGKNCKIYVLNKVDDTVWLSAKVYNKCHPQGIERRYWFICSFYGLDEDNPSIVPGDVDFDVVPNPNNGQMLLSFNNFTDHLDVRVYDMRGILIDQFQATDSEMPYQFKTPVKGIYCFIVTSKGGTISKKIVIN